MINLTPTSPLDLSEELQRLRRFRLWFLVFGIAMVVFGTLAISWACLASVTVAATLMFGVLMLVTGVGEVIGAFRAGRWSGRLLHLVLGVLYGVVGFTFIEHPARSAVQLTLVIAIFLMVGGLFRILFALVERASGWGWILLNGVVSFLLGLMIYKQWPYSGVWVIGLFVGIELIFNGWAWIMLAASLGQLPQPTPKASAAPA
jgi:uncharacterized membrane protein HdeD (DUF308 family)